MNLSAGYMKIFDKLLLSIKSPAVVILIALLVFSYLILKDSTEDSKLKLAFGEKASIGMEIKARKSSF